MAQLSQEYAALLIDYQTMKQNVDRILGLETAEQEQRKEQESVR